MSAALLVLGAELRGAFNRWQRADPHARRFRATLLAIAAFVGLLLLAGSWRAFAYLNFGLIEAPELGPAITIRLVEMAHMLFFVMLFISALSVSLSVLYLDPEIAFLRSCPIAPGSILGARLFLVYLRSSWFVTFTAVPLLAGWAMAHWDWAGWTRAWREGLVATPDAAAIAGVAFEAGTRLGIGLGVLALYNALPTLLGAAAAVLIARFVPARQAKAALLILSVIGLSLAVIGLRAMTPERFLRPKIDPSVGVTLSAIAAPSSPWLPSGWAARVTVDRDAVALGQLLAAIAAAAIVAGVVARRFHAAGLERFLVERDRRRGAARVDVAERLTAQLPRPMALVAAKDLRLFVRDPSQWSQLIILLALVVIYVFNFRQMQGEVGSRWLRDVLSLVNLAMAGFVLVAVANRFVFAALSLEGRAIWLVRSSPFPMHHVLRAKAAVSLLPLLVLSEVITVLANHALGTSTAFAFAAAVLVALMAGTITLMGVGLGALTPRFDLKDPAQIGMTPAGLLFMGTGIAYVGGVVILTATVLMAQGRRFFFGDAFTFGMIAWPVLALAGWTLLASLLPWRMGLARSEQLELR